MSGNRDAFTHAIEAWLDTAEVSEDPGAVLDRVVAQLDDTPQGRTPWPARSFARLSMFASGALGLAAIVVFVVLSSSLMPGGPLGVPPEDSPSPSPAETHATQPEPTPAPEDALEGPFVTGRESVTVAGVRMSFDVAGSGWEAHGGPYISKSTRGPQDAEAVMYWAAFPTGESAGSCPRVLGPSIGPTVGDLATAVSIAPGTELVEGISDVVVGGRDAEHVVVTVQLDYGCDPGYFYTWDPFEAGALWPETIRGDTIRVWIVEVGGNRIFIAGVTRYDVRALAEDEIQQIIDSIEFE